MLLVPFDQVISTDERTQRNKGRKGINLPKIRPHQNFFVPGCKQKVPQKYACKTLQRISLMIQILYVHPMKQTLDKVRDILVLKAQRNL